jgi:mRNA-degrading endonuclease toxin of MazEF toxin-antitoxin module
MTTPRRGDIWTLDTATTTRVLVISSTVYNEIPTEPTVIAIPILTGEPDTGFGVSLSEHQWAATGLIISLRKSRLHQFERNVGTQLLADVNNMLFRILATPER